MAEGRPDGADRLWSADLGRDPAIRSNLPPRDLECLAPDRLLEVGCAASVEGDARASVAAEPPLDGPGEIGRQGLDPSDRAPGPRLEPGLERSIVRCALDRGHAAAVPGDPELTDRRIENGVVVSEPDRDERGMGEAGRRSLGQVAERFLDDGEVRG